jgi:hypothetical protein
MHRSSDAVIAALLALSTAILGQVERGTIVGRVTDSTGLAVPGADIAVHNTGTNVSSKPSLTRRVVLSRRRLTPEIMMSRLFQQAFATRCYRTSSDQFSSTDFTFPVN